MARKTNICVFSHMWNLKKDMKQKGGYYKRERGKGRGGRKEKEE